MPVELAQVAADQKLPFITYSTDMMFDGKSANYHPGSPKSPTNLYGKHKRESKIRVQEIYGKTCIIRLPLLMGNSPSGLHSIHEALWSQWDTKQVTPLFLDKWRNPTSVSNVVELTQELLQKPEVTGLFHSA